MRRLTSPLKSLGLGLTMTCAQIAFAVGSAKPEGSLLDRYRTLVQHDSYWFANIIDRGYNTPVPPIESKAMEVSNVAFFPAYPWLTAAVKRLTNLSTYLALLVTAQAATWGFWTYFFLFAKRWRLSKSLQCLGALAIAAHPAAFFLVAGYSESLFLMTLVGFIYWSTEESRGAQVLAALHGFTMTATRIVGLVCAAFPVVNRIFNNGWVRPKKTRTQPLNPQPASPGMSVIVMALSLLGGILFFVYCQARWSRWDIYLLTQQSGWGIKPDYLAMLKWQNYHWQLPFYSDPPRVSQFVATLATLLFLGIAIAELLAARRGQSNWEQRIGIYFCAAAIDYISFAGVASVQLESMLRYDLCVHALVILALLHFLKNFRGAPVFVRALAMSLAAAAVIAGLMLQSYYIWNFTQGNWVA